MSRVGRAGNKEAICAAIDLEIVMFEGTELNVKAGDAGTDSEQFIQQHKRAILASRDLSLLFALSQHFIIRLFGAWSGVPDTTPPARAKSTKRIINRLII